MRLYRQIEDIGAFLCYRDFDSCEQHSACHVLQAGWVAASETGSLYPQTKWRLSLIKLFAQRRYTMHSDEIERILTEVSKGICSVEDALLSLKKEPFTDLGYAKVDHHRALRQNAAEVVYGAGKTPDQIAGIVASLQKEGEKTVLITRLKPEAAALLRTEMSLTYHDLSGVGIVGEMPEPTGNGKIVIACAGTSDLPVAEEAALTAEVLGNEVVRLFDVGVAGLHRLLAHMDDIMDAQVIIAIAGMEGALASVIGGMASCPVIAVPTSVGYGASFNGLAALLSMLNSCASGVSVVNIDNGFGAAFQAHLINHLPGKAS